MDAPAPPARHAQPVRLLALMARLISLARGAGRRDHHALLRRETGAARPAPAPPATAATEAAPVRSAFVLGETPLAADVLPVKAALEDALRALDAEAARGRTRLTFAVAPGLMLRADPAALGEVLRDVVGGAVRRSPHGEVLVCAAPHGGRVQVSVTDEGADTGEAALAGLSESTRGIVALHGGTLEARHQDGFATVMLRLPAPAARPCQQSAAPGRRHALGGRYSPAALTAHTGADVEAVPRGSKYHRRG